MTSVLSLGGLMAVVDDLRSRADLAMERYADGDDAAFAVVHDDLEPRLLRYAERETHSWSAAEDVVQLTFERIIRHRADYLPGAAVMPWAFAIARRLIIDRHRGAAREGRVAPARRGAEDPGRGVGESVVDDRTLQDEALDQRRREAALERVFERLPPRHREAFRLTRLDGLTVAEAAEVLGLTPANVKVCTFRAAEALRQADALHQRDP
jgi:RNA polymerase sigma-70 factor (ECF subfamily)